MYNFYLLFSRNESMEYEKCSCLTKVRMLKCILDKFESMNFFDLKALNELECLVLLEVLKDYLYLAYCPLNNGDYISTASREDKEDYIKLLYNELLEHYYTFK